jgi:hypothetical protein
MGLIIQEIIIPQASAECAEWISYFNKLEKKFGETNAQVLWPKTWSVYGSTTSCTTKPEFNAFFKKHNIDVSNMATAAVAGITDIGSSILGMGKGFSKILLDGAPVLGLVIVGVVLYSIVRVAKNAIPSDVANLVPQGRVLNLLKK